MARHRTRAEAREAREARLERHAAETDPAVVMNAAARFLELRSRSVHEVTRHLTQAAFPTEMVESAVARLLELGLLDDTAYAKAWVESRDRSRPRGESALRRELSLKGIERETISEILVERSDAVQAAAADGGSRSADSDAAERLLTKSRAALMRVADPRARRSRAYAMLARNGFDPEVCREVSARSAGLDEGADD
ncbi:MAG TPA: regulatory protein RecX [Candidatus Limnocylindrales bacterium]